MRPDIHTWQEVDRLLFLSLDELRFALPGLFGTGNCISFRRVKRLSRNTAVRYECVVADAGGTMRLYFHDDGLLRFDMSSNDLSVVGWLPFSHYMDSEINISIVAFLKTYFPAVSLKTRIKIAALFHDLSIAYTALSKHSKRSHTRPDRQQNYGLVAC